MKKFFLSFALAALVLNFTSCKETTAETSEEEVVETIEATEEPVVEEVVAEEEIDTTVTDSIAAEDSLNTISE